MNPRYIPDTWRKLVAIRAFLLYEYCLIHDSDNIHSCQIDHIISLKHNGIHHPDNLAYCCIFCNRYKGTDVGTIINGSFTEFYNPRKDRWNNHFRLKGALILPKTDVGMATVSILRLNEDNRVFERELLIDEGRYPHANAAPIFK
jgi:hypothetical protein